MQGCTRSPPCATPQKAHNKRKAAGKTAECKAAEGDCKEQYSKTRPKSARQLKEPAKCKPCYARPLQEPAICKVTNGAREVQGCTRSPPCATPQKAHNKRKAAGKTAECKAAEGDCKEQYSKKSPQSARQLKEPAMCKPCNSSQLKEPAM